MAAKKDVTAAKQLQPRTKEVSFGSLADSGVYTSVSVSGGHLKVRIPVERARKSNGGLGGSGRPSVVMPKTVRKWMSPRYLHWLPKEQQGKVASFSSRLRQMPTRFGLILPGLSPKGSGRWIRTEARLDEQENETPHQQFLAEYNRLCQEFYDYLQALDEQHDLLFRKYATVVRIVAGRYNFSPEVVQDLLAAFPESFLKRLRPSRIEWVVANRADVQAEAAREAEAEVARLRATAAQFEATAELQAVEAAAEILSREMEREAWQTVRSTVGDLEQMLLQVKGQFYGDLRSVLGKLEKGGKSTGPAMRRLRNVLDQIKMLNPGGEDISEMVSTLQGLTDGVRQGTAKASDVLTAARQVAEDLKGDAATWDTLVSEYDI